MASFVRQRSITTCDTEEEEMSSFSNSTFIDNSGADNFIPHGTPSKPSNRRPDVRDRNWVVNFIRDHGYMKCLMWTLGIGFGIVILVSFSTILTYLKSSGLERLEPEPETINEVRYGVLLMGGEHLDSAHSADFEEVYPEFLNLGFCNDSMNSSDYYVPAHPVALLNVTAKFSQDDLAIKLCGIPFDLPVGRRCWMLKNKSMDWIEIEDTGGFPSNSSDLSVSGVSGAAIIQLNGTNYLFGGKK